MTGRRAYRAATRSGRPVDLAELRPVEELAILLGSGQAAAAVWCYVVRNPERARQHPADLAVELVDEVPGVGDARAVRAAVYLRLLSAVHPQLHPATAGKRPTSTE